MNKKFLILGASGFLGNEIYNFFRNKNCVGTSFSKKINGLIKINLTKKRELEKILNQENPDIVLNCISARGKNGEKIAYCENNLEEAYQVNCEIMNNLVNSYDGKIVLFSTDNVFDGTKGDYIETDKTNPINNYGKTKELGEQILMNSKNDYLILRMGILYKNEEQGFMSFVYRSLKKKENITCWNDIITCPIDIKQVSPKVDKLLAENAKGIYHLVGPDKLSLYDFAIKIAENFGLEKRLIISMPYSGKINKPKDTSLKTIR